MNNDELIKSKDYFFREQLHFIRRKIGTLINDVKVKEELSKIDQDIKLDNLFQLEGEKITKMTIPYTSKEIKGQTDLNELHRFNIQVYVNRLEKQFTSAEDQSKKKLFLNPIIYAQNEIKRYEVTETYYFKNDFCALEEFIGKSISYLLQTNEN